MAAFTILLLLAQSPTAPAAAGETHWADLGFDRAWFEITAPDAPESAALRLNQDLADKSGAVPPPSPGWRLAGRVIVRTDDPALLRAIAAEASVMPLGELRGFWLADAGSVRAALRLREALAAAFGARNAYLDARRPWALRLPTDPGFGNQWHLHNTVSALADANVEGAWNAGVTGAGVVVGVVDGGAATGHPDLNDNYDFAASQTGGASDHGTSCAGIAAAEEGNGLGGVGAAYDARWSKMYFGFSSQNAAAFSHRNDLNDVKTNSWGPADNGTLADWTTAEANAIRDAVALGRGGLGVVFTWAAGNGGTADRVEYDPYASSRFTIAVGAISDLDARSFYNEQGSCMFAVAQSDGGTRGIYTTSGTNGYTSNFGGTSAASPLGAGVVALLLSANPALTWRDVQHLLVESARKVDPGNPTWTANGAGRDFSVNYGFGAVDATAAVNLALGWPGVAPEQSFDSGTQAVNAALPDDDANGLVRAFTVPTSLTVESVELELNVDHNYIGDVVVELTSPAGTVSTLTKQRTDAQDDFTDYVLTTLRCWGEDAAGGWTVRISDQDPGTTGTWLDWTLRIHGAGGAPDSTLAAAPLVAGQTAAIALDLGVANAAAWLAASASGLGSFPIPQLGVTLGIASPVPVAGPTVADAAGHLDWNLAVPAAYSGLSYWLQAAQSGRVSNVVAGVVQ